MKYRKLMRAGNNSDKQLSIFYGKARVKCWDNIVGEKDRITLLPVKSQKFRIRNNLPSKQTKT